MSDGQSVDDTDQPRCTDCGRTRDEVEVLIRMDDRVMPTPKWYQCRECSRSRLTDTDQ